jgi:NAD(P)-dependent dehydrogenase (short-subunit alcohol dehydrogenase family)
MMSVILITGCSTGLGQATALHLARKGHRVFATMRAPERDGGPLQEAADMERLEISAPRLDVCDQSSVHDAVEAALREAGRIDVLINNAGRGDLGALELATEEQIRGMFETNVFGPLRMAQAVLPSMRARGSGTIVQVSSVAGHIVGLGNGLYAGTKHALEAMSEALAAEVLQFGIRVAIIEPGFFATPIIDKAVASVAAGAAGDGPYANVERRMAGIYMGGKAAAQDPFEVAAVIEHAITTDTPRLRYLVGVDAEVFMRERPKMTDEEYLQSFGRPQSDDEFFAEFMRRFPMPTP